MEEAPAGGSTALPTSPSSSSTASFSSPPPPLVAQRQRSPLKMARPAHPLHQKTGTAEVMVFYPTMEEFRDFPGYIKKIEDSGAHLASGIAKIIPPEGWHPRPSRPGNYDDLEEFAIKNPVKEKVAEAEGALGFVKTNQVYKKEMTVAQFRALALDPKYALKKPDLHGEALENYYWKHIKNGEPIYGADTEGSIYDTEGVPEFNMNHLGTVLDDTRNGDKATKISGVNTVYLYFGMWKTTFPWHAEDMDLYSINYLHFGAPKYWYGISSENAARFEKLMSMAFPDAKYCPAFLRHKNFIVTPKFLREHGIPYATMTQWPNEFMITFPKGYHMGFNTGYNCAESTNFASDRWIDYGKNAILCSCQRDAVEIDMSPFMKKYRPQEFTLWRDYWYGTRFCDSTNSEAGSENSSRKSGTKKEKSEAKKKELEGLYCRRPPDLFSERVYNEKQARLEPHCAVCVYFQTRPRVAQGNIPYRSRRLVPNCTFVKRREFRFQDNITIGPGPHSMTYEDWDDPSEDRLLRCVNCEVVVHEGCYAAVPPAQEGHWRCQRCLKTKDRDDAQIRMTCCAICELRGGALVQAKIGRDNCWAHVVCALLHRRTYFPYPEQRYPAIIQAPVKQGSDSNRVHLSEEYLVVMSKWQDESQYQCEYCNRNQEGLLRCAGCVHPFNLAHVTCAYMHDWHFEIRDWPLVAVGVCPKHDDESDPEDEAAPELKIGDQVYVTADFRNETGVIKVCLHQNAEVKIQEIFRGNSCIVDFMEGSICRDVHMDEIEECDCVGTADYHQESREPIKREEGKSSNDFDSENEDQKYPMPKHAHTPGVRVKVRWEDGDLYAGYLRRESHVMMYSVQFPNGTTDSFRRRYLYGENERRPKESKRRRKSQASHAQQAIAEPDTTVKDEHK